MQEAPGHRADLIEERQGILGSFPAHGTGREEQPQMGVDLFG
jgi:hypothetical protein